MKIKGSWILFSMTVGAVGFAVYDYQAELAKEKKQNEISRILKIEKEQIQSFEVSADAKKIVVEKTAAGWKMLQPVDELADQNAVQDFVEALLLEQSRQVVKQGDAIDWKIYGLDKPVGYIKITDQSGKSIQVDVSGVKNYTADSYIRIVGEPKVLLAASTWGTKIAKPVLEFRDRRLLRTSGEQLISFSLKRGKQTLRVEKKDGQWVAPDQPLWKLSQPKSSELAAMLTLSNTLEFTLERKPTPAELEKFGFAKPDFTVELMNKKNEKYLVQFASTPKQDHYLWDESQQRILRISTDDYQKFASLRLEDFRERHQPFDFDKTPVKKMHIQTGELSADFEMKNTDWQLVNEDKKYEYQKDRPMAILALVRNLEIADFEPPKEPSEKFQIQVRFMDEHSTPIFESEFLGSYQKTIEGQTKNYVYAKTSLFSSPIGVDEASFRSIGLDSLIEKKQAGNESKTDRKTE